MTSSPTIHLLVGGRPACGFSDDVPSNWPAGHVWLDDTASESVTCPQCRVRCPSRPRRINEEEN